METVYQRVTKDGKKEQKIKKQVTEEVITVYEKPDSVSKDSEMFKSEGTVSEVNASEKFKKTARHVISATTSENGSKLTKIHEESIDDLEPLKTTKPRARINSADRDVMDSLQRDTVGRQRSESSDHIKIRNHAPVDEKMPGGLSSSSILKRKMEESRNTGKQVKSNPRKFMFLGKIEECDEEMEDNEAFVAPPPKTKSRRRTRSSRWAKAVGSCELKSRRLDKVDESQKTLELLQQFQDKKIHIENGIIPEEEECESSSDGEVKACPNMAHFLKTTSSPSSEKKNSLGYLYISKRKPQHRKNLSYAGSSEIPSIEGKADVIRDINLKLSSLRKRKLAKDEGVLKSRPKRQSLETQNTPSRVDISRSEVRNKPEEDNSTVKKVHRGTGGMFRNLSDSCETQCLDTLREEPKIKVNRELFKNSKDDTTVEDTEKKPSNNHIITHFNFDINDVKEDPNLPSSSRTTKNPNAYSEFLSKTKRQIEKSKNLTKSSPKIGKEKDIKHSRSGKGLTTLKFKTEESSISNIKEGKKKKSIPKFDRENIKKIKLRLHELRIDPNKMSACNFKR